MLSTFCTASGASRIGPMQVLIALLIALEI